MEIRLSLKKGEMLALCMMLVLCLAVFAFSTDAYADIATSTSGTCSWVIDDSVSNGNVAGLCFLLDVCVQMIKFFWM